MLEQHLPSKLIERPDAGLAARHEAMLLAQRWPDLWPLLNRLTLHWPIDWPAVLIALRHERIVLLARVPMTDQAEAAD